MKKTRSLIMPLLMLTTLLTSCFYHDLAFHPYKDYLDPILTKYEVNEKGYYRLKEYESLEYKDLINPNQTKLINSYRDVYSSSTNAHKYLNMESVGEQNILVLPVSFKDSKKEGMDGKRVHIQNAFFGESDLTVHESVASYYNKVSFGHLKLKGEVAPWFNVDFTSSELNNDSFASETMVARYITSLAFESYRKDHSDELAKFDNDHDGYIDGVMTVYDFPYDYKDGTLFWAFVDHMKENEHFNNELINTIKPYLSSYGWMSYDFLNPKHNIVDSHVYIHEMGHILGLQDYYSKGEYQPLGFMDMMDYNLGDHNIFSKMLLNWTTPYVVKDSTTIEIKPSFNSGDCILIPSGKWNKTPYDEFLLLEYYAPEGVNYYDTRLSFKYKNGDNEEKTGKLFTNYGIKLYHVDSRIGYLENKLIYGHPIAMIEDKDIEKVSESYIKNWNDKGYGGSPTYCIDFPFNNANAAHPYIKMIEADNANTFKNYNAATNSSLFKVGDDMGITQFKDFKFYDGSKPQFSFKIDEISPSKAKITFTKI